MILPVTAQVLEDADSRDCSSALYVRELMGISDSDAAATSRILQLIISSSAMIFAHLDRELQQARIVASYRVNSGSSPQLQLPRTPLGEIKSVQVDGVAIRQEEILEREISIGRIDPATLAPKPWDGKIVVIDFVGGYRMPGQTPLPSGDVTNPQLDPAIFQACFLLVKEFYSSRSRELAVSKTVFAEVTSASFREQKIPPIVIELLAPFRNIGV